MSLSRSVFITLLGLSMASAAWAQNSVLAMTANPVTSSSSSVKPDAVRPNAVRPNAPETGTHSEQAVKPHRHSDAVPAALATKPKPVASGRPVKGVPRPVRRRAGGLAAVRSEERPDNPGSSNDMISVSLQSRKRDPFDSIVQIRERNSGSCVTGKKCLIVDRLKLRGVARSSEGLVAVVETKVMIVSDGQPHEYRRSYFLRENDPVFNGQVIRITADSITFREKVLDKLGHEKTREVVKPIYNGPEA